MMPLPLLETSERQARDCKQKREGLDRDYETIERQERKRKNRGKKETRKSQEIDMKVSKTIYNQQFSLQLLSFRLE